MALGRRARRAPLRRRAGRDQVRARREPEAVQLVESEAALPRARAWASRSSIRERFQAAQDYRKRQDEYRKAAAVKGRNPIPPEPDLQLEAIAEILEGKRLIHCHSYRKDEILQMLRSAEEFGVKVATLQHVLEGYKVADEIARHGAGASGFSDWWAYKFEVYDAIPYAFPLMRERGVVVSYNSDSDELARRLNFEAAKAVKYGGVSPADALAFVTSNPAKQLGIADRVGSLEAGKDGDFVVWSGDPLSTVVDGPRDLDRRKEVLRPRRRTSPRARRSRPSARRSSRRRRRGSTRKRPPAAKSDKASEKPAVSR